MSNIRYLLFILTHHLNLNRNLNPVPALIVYRKWNGSLRLKFEIPLIGLFASFAFTRPTAEDEVFYAVSSCLKSRAAYDVL
jgi:hypothetical protein